METLDLNVICLHYHFPPNIDYYHTASLIGIQSIVVLQQKPEIILYKYNLSFIQS